MNNKFKCIVFRLHKHLSSKPNKYTATFFFSLNVDIAIILYLPLCLTPSSATDTEKPPSHCM